MGRIRFALIDKVHGDKSSFASKVNIRLTKRMTRYNTPGFLFTAPVSPPQMTRRQVLVMGSRTHLGCCWSHWHDPLPSWQNPPLQPFQNIRHIGSLVLCPILKSSIVVRCSTSDALPFWRSLLPMPWNLEPAIVSSDTSIELTCEKVSDLFQRCLPLRMP